MWTREIDSGEELGRINSVRKEEKVSFRANSDTLVYVSEYHGRVAHSAPAVIHHDLTK